MKIPFYWFYIMVLISCNPNTNAKDKQIRSKEPDTLIFPFESLNYHWKDVKNSTGIFALDEGSFWDKRNTILLRTIESEKPAILFQFQKRRLYLRLAAVHPGQEIYANESIQLMLSGKPLKERYRGSASYEGEIILQYKNSTYRTHAYGICDSFALIK